MTDLFASGRIGPVEIRNRIVMPSITTRTADAEGVVTDDTIAYFAARAAGGVGLVTVEMCAPERVGRHRHRELGIYDDRFLPGLTRLADAIHAHGAKASIQLGHGGGHTRRDVCGETPIAPSAVPHAVFELTMETVVPEAMTVARIEETVRAFVAAAARAKAAGFDCVELHAAHGYLLSQFLTPEENVREDEFGGSLENRARFTLTICSRIKSEVRGIGVITRVGVEDFFDGGMPFQEGLRVALWAAESGADALHITAGHYRSKPSAAIMIPPMAEPDATFLSFAARVKEAVAIPVIAVGRLGDPHRARQVVAEGLADFVALGRPLLADPQWPNKVARGESVRRCLACNTCVDQMRAGDRIACLVNTVTGRERMFAEPTPPRGERIAIIGAGPAGLSYAALVADGNTVTVFERASRVGGAFRLAGLAPKFQEVDAAPGPFAAYIDSLEAACREKGVTLRLRADPVADPSLIDGFDKVVIATGASYRFGLGAVVGPLLRSGAGRFGAFGRLFARPGVRDWFYHRARRSTADRVARAVGPGPTVVAIGDALAAGKSKPAIESAFAAALLGDPSRDLSTPPVRPNNGIG